MPRHPNHRARSLTPHGSNAPARRRLKERVRHHVRAARRRGSVGSLTLILLLAVVGSANAKTQANDRLTRIVALVAGGSVATSCETNQRAWEEEVAAGAMASGSMAYYDPDHDAIRFGPAICKTLSKPRLRLTPASIGGLFIAAHEAAHARGIDDEGIANCWGLYWTQDLARRILGARFFTARSRQVLAWARQIQRDSPHEYKAVCPVPANGTSPWQPPTLSPTTTAPDTSTAPNDTNELLTIGRNGVSVNLPRVNVVLPITSGR